ncbi:unnamed protein product [Arabis nemorensis]|uniref:Uncharacterized protein n=1 Tax=Arabis nemorensis TaxID=586526 RepID=A0A565AN95_9BRAS|nr:unnamed protein product [Arabis nemorensis]
MGYSLHLLRPSTVALVLVRHRSPGKSSVARREKRNRSYSNNLWAWPKIVGEILSPSSRWVHGPLSFEYKPKSRVSVVGYMTINDLSLQSYTALLGDLVMVLQNC